MSDQTSPIVPTPQPVAKPLSPPQTPSLIDLVNVLADRADPIVNLIQTTVTSYQHGKEREIGFQKHMSLVALAVVVFIVGIAAFLTYRGKIDGSTFTFLLGLIVGYVLTFVRDQVTGKE